MVNEKDIKLLNDIRHYGDLLKRVDKNEGNANISYQRWMYENINYVIKLVNGDLKWIIVFD